MSQFQKMDVDDFAEIVGITKLANALTVKIIRIAKQTQMSSLNLPLEKITLRPDSVRTRNLIEKPWKIISKSTNINHLALARM